MVQPTRAMAQKKKAGARNSGRHSVNPNGMRPLLVGTLQEQFVEAQRFPVQFDSLTPAPYAARPRDGSSWSLLLRQFGTDKLNVTQGIPTADRQASSVSYPLDWRPFSAVCSLQHFVARDVSLPVSTVFYRFL